MARREEGDDAPGRQAGPEQSGLRRFPTDSDSADAAPQQPRTADEADDGTGARDAAEADPQERTDPEATMALRAPADPSRTMALRVPADLASLRPRGIPKDRDAGERDSRGRDSGERDSRARDSRDRDARDRGAPDRETTDRATTDRDAADRETTDRAATHSVAADRAAATKPAATNPAATDPHAPDRTATEDAPADSPSADRDSTMARGVPTDPEATMALRVPEIPAPAPAPVTPRSGPRRKPGRPTVAAGLTARLAPLVEGVKPLARHLRPRYPRPGRSGWRRWVPSWRQSLGAFLTLFAVTASLLGVAYATTEIPDDLNTYATQQDNVYFWADGTPMARTGWVQRQEMPLKDIPEQVRWAVLAAENESFYSDPGISVSGITRALWRTVGEGDTQGGSTITQQYVKNVYLSQDRSVSRKLTEAMIAIKLDQHMTKDQILEGYLNTSWFGRGTYGMQRASQAYYGKEVSELNVSEAAFLASLLKGAGLYDPALSANNHKRAVERWNWILDRMVKIGKLSATERAKYTHFPEPLKQSRVYDTGHQSDYLVELATSYAKKAGDISDQEFDLGGYQIYTTFDRKRENALTKAVTSARKDAKDNDADQAKTAHYGASSVADDGRILAVYGGPDHRKQGFNESNATTVPAGSAFLPFVYAAGLEHGVRKERGTSTTVPVGPDSVYNGDDDVPVSTPEGPYWDRSGKKVTAHNDGNKSWGQIPLHKALASSVNAPFMQLGMDTGLDKVRLTAQATGMLASSMGPQVPALTMGSSTPSAIRMASSYATFAADGTHTEPYSVRRITRNGTRVALDTPNPHRAVRTEVARQVTEALTESFRTQHPDAASASAQIAGKAGTTDKDTAAWYVGTQRSVSTAIVVYRMDLTESLEPLPLKGLAGSPASTVPYDIWSSALSPLS
ncbi:transglycosylase domain-containing protein [Streptomyces sp. NPDC058371]|uniref:transglycosylase domain-containing protein n=1 Tax=Streptomyces sp. NPDC058371 TaxID=3346463 RepID=UPI0036632398